MRQTNDRYPRKNILFRKSQENGGRFKCDLKNNSSSNFFKVIIIFINVFYSLILNYLCNVRECIEDLFLTWPQDLCGRVTSIRAVEGLEIQGAQF